MHSSGVPRVATGNESLEIICVVTAENRAILMICDQLVHVHVVYDELTQQQISAAYIVEARAQALGLATQP